MPTEQTVLIEWFIGNGTLSAFIVTRQQEIPVYFDYTKEQFQAVVDRSSVNITIHTDSEMENGTMLYPIY